MRRPYYFISLIAVAALLFAGAGGSDADAQSTLSGSDLLAQSLKAYDALSSYSCRITVTTNDLEDRAIKTTATIKYERPGELFVTGTTMFDAPYGLVTDGKSTTVSLNGVVTSFSDIEDGLGFVTGISQSAATTIPALLLHTGWGNPFSTDMIWSSNITSQNVDGRPCFEVIETEPDHCAYWIDKQTFLIDQIATRLNLGVFGKMHELQTITDSDVNPGVPTDSFTMLTESNATPLPPQ